MAEENSKYINTKWLDFCLIIGEGAYSSVYQVKWLEDGKTYALKKVKM